MPADDIKPGPEELTHAQAIKLLYGSSTQPDRETVARIVRQFGGLPINSFYGTPDPFPLPELFPDEP